MKYWEALIITTVIAIATCLIYVIAQPSLEYVLIFFGIIITTLLSAVGLQFVVNRFEKNGVTQEQEEDHPIC